MIPRNTNASTSSLVSCRSVPQHTTQVLEAFNQAEERAIAAWTRIGVAEVDRRNKWSSFVEGRLLPYINDFVHLQEAEEMSIAAENDRLFREMFFTSLRLKEPPQSKILAQLLETTVSQITASSPNAETLYGQVDEECKKNNDGQVRFTGGEEDCNSNPKGEAVRTPRAHGDSVSNPKDPCQTEQNADEFSDSFSLPSFVAATSTILARVADTVGARTIHSAPHSCDEQQPKQQDRRGTSPPAVILEFGQPNQQDKAVLAALQVAQDMTHQELHRTLENEVERMNSLAGVRLDQLCLLYKQRALLRLPVKEQSELRRKYAEKLLMPNTCSKSLHDSRQPSSPLGFYKCISATHSSSSRTLRHSSCATTSNNNSGSGAREELDLLSDSIPEVLCNEQAFPPFGDDHSRVTSPPEETVGRGTIFVVDVSDVTRFGRRQDLSLDRINAEAQEVYAALVAQNEWMMLQAKEEMRAVDELWDLLEEKAVGGEAPALNEEEQVERKHAHERAEEGVLLRREYVDRVEQLVKEYQKAEEDMGATNSAVGASGQPLGSCSLVPLAEEFGCQRAATSHACYNVGGSNTPTAQLPAPLLKLFTAPSYAPILGYIGEVREQLQALVVQHHVRLAQTATEELTRVYQRYFSLTRDTSYRVAPNYSQWINELASAANGEKHGKNCGNANDILRERLCEVQHVMGRITEELNSLNSRLQILGELEPLLQRRAEILEQQRAIQDGSRERLLSRKVNMAKQLLYEENARRQFAQELPKLHEQMNCLLHRWDEANNNATDKENRGVIPVANTHHNAAGTGRRLVLHGVDVAEVVRQFYDGSTHLTSTRNRARLRARGGESRNVPPTPAQPTRTKFPTPHSARDVTSFTQPPTAVQPFSTPAKEAAGATTCHRGRSQPTRQLQMAKRSLSPTPVKLTAAVMARQREKRGACTNQFSSTGNTTPGSLARNSRR